MANRVLISDIDQPHADKVEEAIVDGYGSDISADIETRIAQTFANDVTYAVANGFEAIVRSVSAPVGSDVSGAVSAYGSDIAVFFPLGSNTSSELSYPPTLLVIVTSGAGDTQNQTAFGNGLEFWDVESVDVGFQSSFSNGVVAGKMLKIKDGRAGSWWDARYAARQTASNAGVWDKNDGYGKIDVTAAVAFAGAVPSDPYANTIIIYAASDYTARYAGSYSCLNNYCTV